MILLLLSILLLLVLFAVSYARERSLLAPGVLFCLTWLISYITIVLGSGIFLRIPFEAHLIYLLGATAFVAGSNGSELITSTNPFAIYAQPRDIAISYRIVIVVVAIIVGLSPVFVKEFYSGLTATSYLSYLTVVRQDDLFYEGSKPFSWLRNFGNISCFLCMSLYYLNDGFKRRAIIMVPLIAITLLFNLAAGSKQIIIMLPLTLFFLRAIRKGHLDLTRFAAVVAISVSAFLVLFYIINMQYQTGSIVDVVENWFVILASYTFGGLVSFGQVVLNPTVFENNQSIWRFFIETANSLGANVPIPSLHAGYTSITNYQDLTNIYTIYFSYYMDYGIFGVIVLMFLLGVFLGWVYRQACRGELLCTFFYASFCVAIVLSLHSERFFTALNYYLKQLIFLLVVFWLPTAIVRVASRRVRAIGA